MIAGETESVGSTDKRPKGGKIVQVDVTVDVEIKCFAFRRHNGGTGTGETTLQAGQISHIDIAVPVAVT